MFTSLKLGLDLILKENSLTLLYDETSGKTFINGTWCVQYFCQVADVASLIRVCINQWMLLPKRAGAEL